MKYVDFGNLDYDGSQLNVDFSYNHTGILDSTIISFRGSADVSKHLVDLEDVAKNDFIVSDDMLHFLIDIRGACITEAVLWQRIFIKIIAEELSPVISAHLKIIVNGDDIMINDKKLSVSIATVSHFGGLIHVGLNIIPGKGCPVRAIGLEELLACGLDIFRNRIAGIFLREYEDICKATYKVIAR